MTRKRSQVQILYRPPRGSRALSFSARRNVFLLSARTPILSQMEFRYGRVTSSFSVPLGDLKCYINGWIVDCRYRQLSPATVWSRDGMLGKLVWWMEHNEIDTCGRMEIQQFLSYVCDGHTDPDGRWGNPHEREANRPSTAATFHSRLSSFFSWLVNEGYIEQSPMATLRPPVVRCDQIQPFTEDQIQALLRVARESRYPKRDEAILLR